jgi:hypothetical protein
VLVLGAACDRPPVRAIHDVTTTSGALPRPVALPPPSRTTDSTGFVDNAGRTSDQRDRTEASGMRPTETGAQAPTGTPGSGFPMPLEPPQPAPPAEAPRPDRMAIGPVPADEGTVVRAVLDEVTVAYCERELACGRIVPSEGFGCTRTIATRYREDLGRAECPFSFDIDSVVSCTSAIRATPCDVPADDLSEVPECKPETMCLPR